MKVIYNTANYPYYKIKFTNAKYTDEGFEEHIKNFHNLYNLCIKNNGKMILIIDISDLSMPPINFIQKQVKFMKDIKPLSKEYIGETIFITSSITKTFDPFFILKPRLNVNLPFILSQKIVSFFKIFPIS